jgi:hypothetical protein
LVLGGIRRTEYRRVRQKEIRMKMLPKILATAVIAGAPWLAGTAVAGPIGADLSLRNTMAPSVETVQWRGRGWRGGWGRGWGPAAGVGLAAGAIIGGAIAASQPYGYYDPYYAPAYGYGPGYGGGGYVAVAPGGDDVAYCMQRFRSYDPRSGTYLGYDGMRHPCP